MKQKTLCPDCHGTGKIPLQEHLQETLGMIPKVRGTTAHELHEFDPSVSPNAFSNRLRALQRLKFVVRKREGKFWRYSRA